MTIDSGGYMFVYTISIVLFMNAISPLCLCDVTKLRRTVHGEKYGSVTGALGTIGQYVQGIFDSRALASIE